MSETLKDFLEVKLVKDEDFLRVKETLTRIGLTAKGGNILVQSCHILHKKGQYFICGFNELFKLDGRGNTPEPEDLQRRNRIANLLQEWGLVTVVDSDKHSDMIPLNRIKIIAFKDKHNWTLKSNYSVGQPLRKYGDKN